MSSILLELFTYSDGSSFEIDVTDSQALVSEFKIPSAGECHSASVCSSFLKISLCDP